MQVETIGKADWYSTFLVNKKVKVKTVDIYTYQCENCKSYNCKHVMAVQDYILAEYDKYASST